MITGYFPAVMGRYTLPLSVEPSRVVMATFFSKRTPEAISFARSSAGARDATTSDNDTMTKHRKLASFTIADLLSVSLPRGDQRPAFMSCSSIKQRAIIRIEAGEEQRDESIVGRILY